MFFVSEAEMEKRKREAIQETITEMMKTPEMRELVALLRNIDANLEFLARVTKNLGG